MRRMVLLRVQPLFPPRLYVRVHTADWVRGVSQSICVCDSFSSQCVITEWDCVVSLRGDRGLRRLSHCCKSCLLEQWLELTAVPVTGLLHSPDALCHSQCLCVCVWVGLLIEKKPSGILKMLLKDCVYILYSQDCNKFVIVQIPMERSKKILRIY